MNDGDFSFVDVDIDVEQLLSLRQVDHSVLSVGTIRQVENVLWADLIGPVWLGSE